MGAFSQHGVPFWTSGGTTLGIVRHGGLILWDDDLDICLREQDEHLLEKGHLAKTLEAVGCRVARAKDYSWKVWLDDQSDDIVSVGGKTESFRFPFCDIFIMCKRKGRYEVRGKQGRSAWPEEWYTVHQVGFLQVFFGIEPRNRWISFEYFVPNESEEMGAQ